MIVKLHFLHRPTITNLGARPGYENNNKIVRAVRKNDVCRLKTTCTEQHANDGDILRLEKMTTDNGMPRDAKERRKSRQDDYTDCFDECEVKKRSGNMLQMTAELTTTYSGRDDTDKTWMRCRKPSTQYKEGDLVAIKRTQFGTGMKLKPKYLGPHRVSKVKHNDRYDVEKLESATEGPNKTSSSVDQMKPWPQISLFFILSQNY
ncbi:hypothetical protein ABMA27_008830 [Loxostege sticticalis]|uniref:Uncharacterized protein n=1 Tax=Loxostege sticticalis TaxID=481309 RepID=A0ABR3H9D1_LOXSC